MIRSTLSYSFLALFMFACINGQASKSDATLASNKFQLSSTERGAIKGLIDESGFSGVVAIVENGRVIFSYARGYEDRNSGRLNTINTRFALASVGKLFTAIAIHQLVERGDIKLSDHVGRFLPDYANPIVRKKVTIQHLLKMQSGLGDIFDRTCDETTSDFSNHEGYFCLFQEDAPIFEPGTNTAYSNAGYIILGRIVEIASGKDFYSYIEDSVHGPSGMQSTAYDDASVIRPGMAFGYIYKGSNDISGRTGDEKELAFEPNNVTGRGSAAGGGYSSIGDFSKLDQALRSGQVITKGSLGKIFSDEFIKGKRSAGISGGAPGVTTRYRLRADGISIIAFGNSDLASAPNVVKSIEKFLDK